MERYVELLFERLDQIGQCQLISIMDNAINEMHNNGIIANVSDEIAAKIHDPDPNVRVTEKTSLAKSVGYSFVVSSKPDVCENGICYTVEISNNEKFPNSIAICIQGGLEGLYQTGIYMKAKTKVLDYNVLIHKNGQNSTSLEKNLNILDQLYENFHVNVLYDNAENLQKRSEDKQEKKKGLFAKLFSKS